MGQWEFVMFSVVISMLSIIYYFDTLMYVDHYIFMRYFITYIIALYIYRPVETISLCICVC